MSCSRFLFTKGAVSTSLDIPPVSTFLQSHPGAYTTTRTHSNATSLLFWDRHLQRLCNSVNILLQSKPQLLFHTPLPSFSYSTSTFDRSMIEAFVSHALREVMPVALAAERQEEAELAVTTVVTGHADRVGDGAGIDVHLHVSQCVPPVFGTRGAHLAVVGHGRDVAEAKYTDWVVLRKSLEKLRPPTVTELLLSNDGDQVLEGSVTNFFVVARKDNGNSFPFEVQTAPVKKGVLPGVIRQLVIDVCLSKGIPLKEVAPSWSQREFWQEAFITSSLRIMEHVEKIQVPSLWESLELKTHEDISWDEKQFEVGPGTVTTIILKEIMENASREGHLL